MPIEEGFLTLVDNTPQDLSNERWKNIIHSNNFKFLLQLYLFVGFFKTLPVS